MDRRVAPASGWSPPPSLLGCPSSACPSATGSTSAPSTRPGQLAFSPAVMDLAAVASPADRAGAANHALRLPGRAGAPLRAPRWPALRGGRGSCTPGSCSPCCSHRPSSGAASTGLRLRWAVLGTLAWAPAAAGVVSGQNHLGCPAARRPRGLGPDRGVRTAGRASPSACSCTSPSSLRRCWDCSCCADDGVP